MTQRAIVVTQTDLSRLQNLIIETRRVEMRKTEYLEQLENELTRAIIVHSNEIPSDVITMNSTATLLDTITNDEMQVTLVYPDNANVDEGKISVLAPIGTAMIGYKTGDIFEWQVPDGIRRLKVVQVLFQPEAEGNYDL